MIQEHGGRGWWGQRIEQNNPTKKLACELLVMTQMDDYEHTS